MKLPIEMGRWQNIPRQERKCYICDVNEVGDEFHYLFKCTDIQVKQARHNLMPTCYYKNPNTYKFKELFNSKNVKLLEQLCKFIKIIEERVIAPG